jgi:predicted PolB exonuclease-like 3'-5' exonuclease
MDLFMFDIETAGNYKDFYEFEQNDERGANLFKSKYLKMGWDSKYENIHEAYLDNAGIISTYGRIVCISFGFMDKGEYRISSFYGDDEKEIVEKFNNLLKKIETKSFNLSGFRIMYFDIPWILHKLIKYGIKPADIIVTHGKKPWEMRVVDISDDWRGKFAWAYNFDEVCYQLGIDSPKDNMNGSEVHLAYYQGKLEQIKDYCESDVKASIKVSELIYSS